MKSFLRMILFATFDLPQPWGCESRWWYLSRFKYFKMVFTSCIKQLLRGL